MSAFAAPSLTSATSSSTAQLHLADNQQAKCGTDLDLPACHVHCGKWQSICGLTEADLGDPGKAQCFVFAMKFLLCFCTVSSLLLLFSLSCQMQTSASNAVCAVIHGFNPKTAS